MKLLAYLARLSLLIPNKIIIIQIEQKNNSLAPLPNENEFLPDSLNGGIWLDVQL